PTTMTPAVAASSASPASGARQRILAIMASNFDASWTTAYAKKRSRNNAGKIPTMSEYEFTLKFRLPDASADPGQFIGALAEAGCDDAAVGIGQQGRIALDFTREAASALDAIISAIQAVKAAIPGAELIEASPDFVGLADVADLIGCTRQK